MQIKNHNVLCPFCASTVDLLKKKEGGSYSVELYCKSKKKFACGVIIQFGSFSLNCPDEAIIHSVSFILNKFNS